jgi:hypothetical protein
MSSIDGIDDAEALRAAADVSSTGTVLAGNRGISPGFTPADAMRDFSDPAYPTPSG